ncbi:MAG TPA: phage/plasmid primase, P4 family, partial [Pirellulales bacterium]|nr:phage/plasmid primase, P4 family [Pirellulales bacterium]
PLHFLRSPERHRYSVEGDACRQAEWQTKKTATNATIWTYQSVDRKDVMAVVRVDLDDGNKTYRPYYYTGKFWQRGDPPGKLPLYDLPSIPTASKVYIVEGEKCAEAAKQLGFVTTTSAHGANGGKNTDWSPLAGKEVILLPDSDPAGEMYATSVARWLSKLTPPAKCHIKRLPGLSPSGDICNFIAACGDQGKTDSEIAANIEALPLCELLPATADVSTSQKEDASELDPGDEARSFLKTTETDGVPCLQYHNETWLHWRRGAYRIIPQSEVRAQVIRSLDVVYRKLSSGNTNNVCDHLRAQAMLSTQHDPPCWICEVPTDWPADEILATRNKLVHLPSLVESKDDYQINSTPRFFGTAALEFDFDPQFPEPKEWLSFLHSLWGDDIHSIEVLQEWLGYLLTQDTRYQKILLLLGPKRSGKGTIARVLRELVGRANVAGPTLASFSQNFGLWPLLGKSVAIISDARLSHKSDQAIIAERLLSVSGEDAVTVDRKFLEPVTCKLSTRLIILTNELPRLSDSSGALAGRFIVLRLTESFFGREDTDLTQKLLVELPGILLWAIEGWRRLRERGRFEQPRGGEELVEDMHDLGSPIGAFVRERCLIGPEYETSICSLYSEWKRWCEIVGRRDPGTEQIFGRDLTTAIPAIRRVRKNTSGVRERFYVGVKAHAA